MDAELAKLNLLTVQEPGKPVLTPVRILHIQLWYQDGSQSEMNLTSPIHDGGDDVDYLRMYLQKVAPRHGIVAYQASMIYNDPVKGLRSIGTYEKIDCTKLTPFKPGQYCNEQAP